jgi:two-component system nitrogen regulation response regulator NtrX
MNAIYVVDDDPSILDSLKVTLEAQDYCVRTATAIGPCLDMIEEEEPAVVICDIFFGDSRPDGESLVKALAERCPNTQCIVISGESDIGRILSCLKLGARDFIEKPISLPRLLTAVGNAMAAYQTKTSSQARYAIQGTSRAIQEVISRTKKLAPLNECVLICGENGTGKELVAANLHLFSGRYALPMNIINCTALNPNILESELFGHKAGSFTGADKDKKGFFEISRRSSMFIDEIGDFAPNLQSKLLRVVQEKKIIPVGSTFSIDIDVRLIFATHHDLEERIRAGAFREDLYFRISTFTIQVPPLRERLEDIDVLAPHFLANFLKENNLTPKFFSGDALARLKEYHYPGNVRELAKIVKNAAFFSENEMLTVDDIDFSDSAAQSDIWVRCRKNTLTEARTHFEKELLVKRLEYCQGDLKKTAESLGILVNNLYRKLHEHNIPFNEI